MTGDPKNASHRDGPSRLVIGPRHRHQASAPVQGIPPHINAPRPPAPKWPRNAALAIAAACCACAVLYAVRVGFTPLPAGEPSSRELAIDIEARNDTATALSLMPVAELQLHAAGTDRSGFHPACVMDLVPQEDRPGLAYVLRARQSRRYLARLEIMAPQAALLAAGRVRGVLILRSSDRTWQGTMDLPSPLDLAVTQRVAVALQPTTPAP